MKATPAAVALRMELKLESMKTRRRQLQLGFWKVLCSSEQDRVLARVFRHRHAEVVAGGARLSGLQAFKRFYFLLDVPSLGLLEALSSYLGVLYY